MELTIAMCDDIMLRCESDDYMRTITIKQLIERAILGVANRSQLVRRTAAFIVAQASSIADSGDTYGYLRQKFISNGRNSRFNLSTRSEVVR